MKPHPLHSLWALALLLLAGCDTQEPFRVVLGFDRDAPRPVVAGEPFPMRVIGRSDGTFEYANVVAFRGGYEVDPERGVFGDTLAFIPLDIEPGVSSFEVEVVVTVPAGAVTQPEGGWLLIESVEGGCTRRCIGATGTSIELVPAG